MAATEKGLLRLQNGSDVRGVAVAGVADEPVNLTPRPYAVLQWASLTSWKRRQADLHLT